MTDNHSDPRKSPHAGGGASRLLGSLRDALLAAGRETTDHAEPLSGRDRSFNDAATVRHAVPVSHALVVQSPGGGQPATAADTKEANREPRSQRAVPGAVPGAVMVPAAAASPARVPVDSAELVGHVPRTQPAGRGPASRFAAGQGGDARTQFLRGRQKVSRANFHQDPVVGWLVVVGGPGLGAHRSIYEGNNTVGRASSQRIAIDFGDDTISGEEQAYIRYDSHDRSFLFVPNLAKTNVVQVNDKKPTGAVALEAMDVITMGRTQLVFVPFCGPEFDWAELSGARE